MNPDNPGADPAKARYLVIQVMRLAGLALAVLGVAVIAGKITAVPQAAGYALVLIGVAQALAVPSILARRWRTPLP